MVGWSSRVVGVVLSAVLAAFMPPAAADDGLPLAADLQADARQARAEQRPLLVFFSAQSCPYCRQVAELYLQPMLGGGQGAAPALIRMVDIDSHRALRDLAGNLTDHAGFARQSRVSLTPHIKFLDLDGRELAPGLLGYSTPDFYAGYLDAAIGEARAQLLRCSVTEAC